MSSARSRANQKLHHAAIQLQMLHAEADRHDIPLATLLEASAAALRLHLLDAYGWFLLELAEAEPLPARPPQSVAELMQDWPQPEPLRGELVELQGLEGDGGWLTALQAEPVPAGGTTTAGPEQLALASANYSEEQLQDWFSSLEALIDRMSDSLEEC